MITLREAQNLINRAIRPLAPVEIPLYEACGCALAEDVVSEIDVPSFANSVMDGIAARLSDLSGTGPWRLKLISTVAAGDSEPISLHAGQAVKIMTGAPVPDGADIVVPVEDIDFERDFAVIRRVDTDTDYIRPAGDDIKAGQRIYASGMKLGPIDIGVLGSIGRTNVLAIPKPRIALFSTGDEIVNVGKKLKRGQIYDSNGPTLRALLRDDGFDIELNASPIPDKRRESERFIDEAFITNDLVITTGAVSVGDFDLIPDEIRNLGGEIIFHKVAIKPGKPVLLARIGTRVFVGLPGNPVGAVVGYHLFVRPVISRMMGADHIPRRSTALLSSDLRVEGNRLCVIGAHLEDDGAVTAQPVKSQKSGRLYSISGINGFILVDGGTRTVRKGSKVTVEWL